ncbi:MAG: hypothetical protein DWQ07_25550 [Chloroflexi bacterium]|nr:MAG: hypothetical protein DWQ07_25550 [Chloroflexota bacterium]MBL1197183.1 hypothetical protein [Chloroflexota bacterium]
MVLLVKYPDIFDDIRQEYARKQSIHLDFDILWLDQQHSLNQVWEPHDQDHACRDQPIFELCRQTALALSQSSKRNHPTQGDNN